MTNRRSFLFGGAALIASPAIVRAESLMKLAVPKPAASLVIPWPPSPSDIYVVQLWDQMEYMKSAMDAACYGTGALIIKPGAVNHVPFRLIPMDIYNRMQET